MPSGDVAATVEGLPPATATKTPFPKVTELSPEDAGRVLDVHVIPSGEDIPTVDVVDTAAKIPFP